MTMQCFVCDQCFVCVHDQCFVVINVMCIMNVLCEMSVLCVLGVTVRDLFRMMVCHSSLYGRNIACCRCFYGYISVPSTSFSPYTSLIMKCFAP